MVLLTRVDGKMQAVRGYSMTKVTCDFPEIDLTRAVNAVKEDAPDNQVLQSCKLPSKVGGEVDCLLGIKYSFIHPEPVHMLAESGLCIYKSKLLSHDGVTNALIGATHESFDFFSERVGGVGQLLAHFMEGLAKFRQGSVPSIGINPACFEEIEYAKQANMKLGEFSGLVNLEDLVDHDGFFWEGNEKDSIRVIVG